MTIKENKTITSSKSVITEINSKFSKGSNKGTSPSAKEINQTIKNITKKEGN